MRLNTNRLGHVEIPRNDVLSGYKSAWINAIIQSSRFKRKFLECWDGSNSYSLFYDENKEQMVKLLGIHNQFDGETDLTKTKAKDGLRDLQLVWQIKMKDITNEHKEIVLEHIRHIFEEHGYSVTYTINADIETILANNIQVVDEDIEQIYRLIIEILNKGFGTYEFTFEQMEEQLRYKIFEEEHIEYIKNQLITEEKKTIGIPSLATFGITEEVETIKINPLVKTRLAENKLIINVDDFNALPADEFVAFINSFLEIKPIKKKQKWYQKLFKIILIIVSIITIIYGGYALASYAFTGSTAGLVGASALGLTSMAFGAGMASAFLVLQMYGAVMTLKAMNEKVEEAVNTPEEIKTKISMAEETYWTYHDSDKPEAQILSVLEGGKP